MHRSRAPGVRALAVTAVAFALMDVFLLVADLLHPEYTLFGRFPAFAHPGWFSDPDGSFAEVWGYALEVTAGGLLVYLWRRTRGAGVLLAAGTLFLVVALDDIAQIHERVGNWLAGHLTLPSVYGLGLNDYSEVLVWAALGLPLVVWLLRAYVRSDPHPRRVARALLAPSLALLFAAMVVDLFFVVAVHWGWSEPSTYAISLLEIAGELGALTAVCVVVAAFASGRGPAFSRPGRGRHRTRR